MKELFLFVLGVALLYFFAVKACPAHSWYPSECCSGRDCHEAKKGEVLAIHGGYIVDGRWFREYKQTRPSPDGKFHVCATSVLRCLFVPQPSF